MPGIFDDFEFPQETSSSHSVDSQIIEAEIVEDTPVQFGSTAKTCGCIAAIGGGLMLLLIGVAVSGFLYFQYQREAAIEAQKQIARQQAKEQLERFEADRQNRARRQAEADALRQENERKQIEADRERRTQMEALRKQQDEENRKQAEGLRIEQEFRQENDRNLQRFGIIANALYGFQHQSAYLFPNAEANGYGLSWRVHLLPFLGHQLLYKQFNLEEPWNSETNIKLLQAMPENYGDSALKGKTRFRSLLNVDGTGAPYVKTEDVRDGQDVTAILFCVGNEAMIEWTKPDDLENAWDLQSISKVLDWPTSRSAKPRRIFLLGNKQAKFWSDNGDPATLFALATAYQGELINLEPGEDKAYAIINMTTQAPNREDQQTLISRAEKQLDVLAKAVLEFDSAVAKDTNLKPKNDNLSWRVHLLPYLGHKDLYSKFNLAEAWNSPTNFPLLSQMPEIYASGSSTGRTRLVWPIWQAQGANGFFSAAPARLGELTNGANVDSTPFLYFAAQEKSNYWTRPDRDHFNASELYWSLGWKIDDSVSVAMLSGRVLQLPGKLHQSKTIQLINWETKVKFDLDSALAEPSKPLRLTPDIQPASALTGLVSLPKVGAIKVGSPPNAEVIDKAADQRLNRIALAIHNYESSFRKAPPNGAQSGLSWRVHLLPFLDQQNLYEKFVLNEPWDSPTNLALAAEMPSVYGEIEGNMYLTDMCIFSGKGTILSNPRWMPACTDGLENTALVIQVSKNRRVPWTKPEDIEFHSSLRISDIAGQSQVLRMALGNGQILPLYTNLPDSVLTALGTSTGKELVDGGTVRRLSMHILGIPITTPPARLNMQANRLKQLSFCMHNYESSFRCFPPRKNARNPQPIRPLEEYCLSWRVHILPYMGYHALYDAFRLKEPWDSPHNKQLIPLMPDIFRDEDDAADSYTTRIQVVVGEGMPFSAVGEAPQMKDLIDGTSNTLMMLVAPKDKSVVWTKPADYEVELSEDFKELRTADGVSFATFDGAVHRLPMDFDSKRFKALLTHQGKEIVDVGQMEQR